MFPSSSSRTRILAVALLTIGFAKAGDEYKDDCCPDNRGVTVSGINNGVLGAAWANSHDVGGRLAAYRAGIRPTSRLVGEPSPSPVSDSKSGMGSAKGSKISGIAVPKPNQWEVFGGLFYYSENRDGETFAKCYKKKHDSCYVPPGCETLCSQFISGVTSSSLEVFGGNAGIEYHLNSEWTLGAGIGGSSTRVDLGAAGRTDIDSMAISPYLSYYKTDAIGYTDFWADLLYSYGRHSIDSRRFTDGGIASGSPDADTHAIEFTMGLNFGENAFKHGPYAGLRYITGTVDAYTEIGPGANYFGEQNLDSLVSILGYQMSWKLRTSGGYWVPQIRVAWEHEFEDGNVRAFGSSVDERDEDLAVIGANLSYYFDNGWNVGLEYEGRFGSKTDGHYGGVRLGKEF